MGTPLSLAAATSMLLYPAAGCAMSLRWVAAKMLALSTVPVRQGRRLFGVRGRCCWPAVQ